MEFQEIIELCKIVLQIKKQYGYPDEYSDSSQHIPAANFMVQNNCVFIDISPNGKASDEWDYNFPLGKSLNAQQKENLKSCKEKLNRILK
jgi:hypothetical protein